MSHRLSNGLESEALRAIQEEVECSVDAAFSTLNSAVEGVLEEKSKFDAMAARATKGSLGLGGLQDAARMRSRKLLKQLPGCDQDLVEKILAELFPTTKFA